MGRELETLAQITNDLQVGLTYDHSNLQYVSFLPGVPAASIASLNATRTLNNPPNKFSLSTHYHLPLPSAIGNVSVQTNWNWQATSGDVSVANGFGLTHSFGLLNGAANWNGVAGSTFDISLFGSNLLNKVYVTQSVESFQPEFFGYGTEIFGEPRMYGVRVKYRFGAAAAK